MLNDLLNSVQRDGAITEAVFAGILSGPVAFVTSRASTTYWSSLTVSVYSHISGEAGALAALSDEGRVGVGEGGVMGEMSSFFRVIRGVI